MQNKISWAEEICQNYERYAATSVDNSEKLPHISHIIFALNPLNLCL